LFPFLLSSVLSLAVPVPAMAPQAAQILPPAQAVPDPTEAEARRQLSEAQNLDAREAIPRLDALVRRYGEASEPGLHGLVDEVLALKVRLLFDLGRFDSGTEAHRALHRRRPAAAPQERDPFQSWDQEFAEQLYFAAQAHQENWPNEPGNPPYDVLLRLYGKSQVPGVAYLVASAMVNQGAARNEKGHQEAAIQLFGQVATRFGDLDEPRVFRTVNTALANRGGVLRDLHRPEEADRAYAAVGTRNEAAKQDGKDEGSLRALHFRGLYATEQGHFDAALGYFDEVLRRMEALPGEATQIIGTMINRGYALGEAGRHEEALAQYQALLDRFGDSGDADLRQDLASPSSIKAGC